MLCVAGEPGRVGLTASPVRLAAMDPAPGLQQRPGSTYNIWCFLLHFVAGLSSSCLESMLCVVGEPGRLGLTASPVRLVARDPVPGP
jgi:hypothetical protein